MNSTLKKDVADFANLDLSFDTFRQLAVDPALSMHNRIAFPDSYRAGYETAILADITRKVPALTLRDKIIVDIGPGCAGLPRMIGEACGTNGSRLVLVDSREMLDHLPDRSFQIKVEGPFPGNFEAVRAAAERPADGIICYSVLHIMFAEANPFSVLDRCIEMLAPGGVALFGDIPNASKRRRFFSSAAGIRFHQEFTDSNTLPPLPALEAQVGRIDDAVLAGLVMRAQSNGCDAYVVPQAPDLPMANRRDDLLVRKP